MKRKKKSPWIAALLNFLLLGAGYVYLDKRVVFGWMLILTFVIMTFEYFIGGMNHFVYIAETHSVSWTVLTIAVAYDGYQLAKESKRRR